MAKIPSSWRRPGQVNPSADYDGSTIDYDSPAQKYADTNNNRDTSLKTPDLWTRTVKVATRFVKNIAAQVNDAMFDTHRIYDVHDTYDSIVVNEPHSTAKKPQTWSRQ